MTLLRFGKTCDIPKMKKEKERIKKESEKLERNVILKNKERKGKIIE